MADGNADNGQQQSALRRPGHHRPRGPRGRPQAPGHVHRLDRRRAACTTSSTRSSTTRSTRRSPATATRSTVTIHPDNSVTVVDNGRGIPVAMMEKEGKPAVEVVLTVLHAGGKFGDGGGYKVSGGLHGVGVSVVNALSERARRRVRRDGFTSGASPTCAACRRAPLAAGRADGRDRHDDHVPAGRRDLRDARLRVRDARAAPARDRVPHARACGSRSTDERGEGTQRAEFHYEGGIEDFVALPQREQGRRSSRRSSSSRATSDEGAVEVAMQWNSSYQESIFSFANNINTHEGGSHLSGFRSALTRTLNRYAREKGHLKEKDDEPLRRGRARGPDRGHLGQAAATRSSRARRRPSSATRAWQGFVAVRRQRASSAEFLEENPQEARRGSSARPSRPPRPAPPRARRATSRAQVRAGRHSALPGKLADCSVKRPGAHRAVHRRGRLRRRLGQAGPRPRDAGGAPAARQDPQRREGADRQGAAEHRDPGADHGARHRRARRVRHRAACATTRSS